MLAVLPSFQEEQVSLPNGRSGIDLSLETLRNDVIVLEEPSLFSEVKAKFIAWKLDCGRRLNLTYGLYPLKRDRWLDCGLSVYEEHENNLRMLLGKNEFEKLSRYSLNIKEKLESEFEGALDRYRVDLRTYRSIPTRIEDGNVSGMHRHLYPNADFLDISVLKSELGPAPIAQRANGEIIRPKRGDAMYITDALHGSPPEHEVGRRLVILIIARFSSEKYRGYYQNSQSYEVDRE